MVFRPNTVINSLVFCAISGLASLHGTSPADATKTRVIHLMPQTQGTKQAKETKAAPTRRATLFHKKTRKYVVTRKRRRTRNFQRPGILSPVVFGVEQDNFQESSTLGVPNVCSLKWHENGGHGYRKVICKRGYRAHFPAHRPWAYENLPKTANWQQSRAWGGHFQPHNHFQGKLEITDHSREFQGNPYHFLADPRRYRQSSQFRQKIYFPPAPWQ